MPRGASPEPALGRGGSARGSGGRLRGRVDVARVDRAAPRRGRGGRGARARRRATPRRPTAGSTPFCVAGLAEVLADRAAARRGNLPCARRGRGAERPRRGAAPLHTFDRPNGARRHRRARSPISRRRTGIPGRRHGHRPRLRRLAAVGVAPAMLLADDAAARREAEAALAYPRHVRHARLPSGRRSPWSVSSRAATPGLVPPASCCRAARAIARSCENLRAASAELGAALRRDGPAGRCPRRPP